VSLEGLILEKFSKVQKTSILKYIQEATQNLILLKNTIEVITSGLDEEEQ